MGDASAATPSAQAQLQRGPLSALADSFTVHGCPAQCAEIQVRAPLLRRRRRRRRRLQAAATQPARPCPPALAWCRIAPLTALTAHNVQLRQTFNPPLQQQRRQPYSFLLSHNSRPGVRSRQQRTVSVASSALEQQQEQEQGLQTEATEVEALAAVMGQQPDGEGAETVAKRLRQEGGGAQPQPQALQQQQQQQQPKRKKARVLSPEMLARQAIHQAAKENDLQGALAVFDRAKAEGVRLSADLYISLLYLCSGGDAWEQRLSSSSSLPPSLASAAAGSAHAAAVGAAAGQQQQQQEEQQQEQLGEAVADDADAVEQAAVPSPQLQQQLDAAVVLQRAQGIFDEMTTSGVGEGAASAAAAAGASAAADGSGGGGKRLQRLAPTEMCFTALARLYACSGDADRAFQLAKVKRRWHRHRHGLRLQLPRRLPFVIAVLAQQCLGTTSVSL